MNVFIFATWKNCTIGHACGGRKLYLCPCEFRLSATMLMGDSGPSRVFQPLVFSAKQKLLCLKVIINEHD